MNLGQIMLETLWGVSDTGVTVDMDPYRDHD